MPRTEKQIKEIRKASKHNIRLAALELFAKYGFKGVSVDQIAKKAKISKGLIYNYYSSKKDLLIDLIKYFMNEGNDIMQIIQEKGEPEIRFRKFIDALFHYIENKPKINRLITGLALHFDELDFIKDMVEQKSEGYLQLFGNFLNELKIKNAEDEARFLAAFIDGAALQYVTTGKKDDLRKLKAILIHKYLEQ